MRGSVALDDLGQNKVEKLLLVEKLRWWGRREERSVDIERESRQRERGTGLTLNTQWFFLLSTPSPSPSAMIVKASATSRASESSSSSEKTVKSWPRNWKPRSWLRSRRPRQSWSTRQRRERQRELRKEERGAERTYPNPSPDRPIPTRDIEALVRDLIHPEGRCCFRQEGHDVCSKRKLISVGKKELNGMTWETQLTIRPLVDERSKDMESRLDLRRASGRVESPLKDGRKE